MRFIEDKFVEKDKQYKHIYELDDNDIDMLEMVLSEYYFKNAGAVQQEIIRKYFSELGSDIYE